MSSGMTWGLELTADELTALKALDAKSRRQETSEIETRLLKLELVEQSTSGALYRTAYGALRLLIAKD